MLIIQELFGQGVGWKEEKRQDIILNMEKGMHMIKLMKNSYDDHVGVMKVEN